MDERLRRYLKEKQGLVDHHLADLLPPAETRPEQLHEGIRYVVLGDGKRVRPLLVLAAGEAVGGSESELIHAACAVEILHAYTLVHDDLPAMDDDDIRRGRPTCHKVFGEGMAILIGDGLQALAFELLARAPLPPERVAEAVALLARRTGSLGLVGGQAADIDGEGKSGTREEVEFIHHRKTAELITACVELGAVCSGAAAVDRAALIAYGRTAGLAFQIIDDVLDATLTTEEMGKDAGSDLDRQKTTFPGVIGLAASEQLVQELVGDAQASIAAFGEKAWVLRTMVDYFAERMRRRQERSLQKQCHG